jgi:hypothetical protein
MTNPKSLIEHTADWLRDYISNIFCNEREFCEMTFAEDAENILNHIARAIQPPAKADGGLSISQLAAVLRPGGRKERAAAVQEIQRRIDQWRRLYELALGQAEINKGETTALLIALGIEPLEPGAYLRAGEEIRRLQALDTERRSSTSQNTLY